MKTHRLLLAVFALSALLARAQDDAPKTIWYADYDAAVAAAKEAKKDLFIDFTGSDWCGWCKRLDAEVFEHAEFLDAVQKNYVLVALDFPNSPEIKAMVPNPERNDELKKKHGVTGFPTILLVSVDGEAFGRTGYQEGGAELYVSHIDSVAKEGRAALADAKKLAADYAAAEDDAARLVVVEAAITRIGTMSTDQIGHASIAAVVKHALTLDADNAMGLKQRALLALIKGGGADEDMLADALKLDPKNELGLQEWVVVLQTSQIRNLEELAAAADRIEALFALGTIKDAELEKQLNANMAFWNFKHLKNADKAKLYAKRLKDLVGDDANYKPLIDMIEGDK